VTVSKVLSQWTANDIAYSLRLLIASPPQIFVVAVGPVGKDTDANVRVSAEPVRRDDVPKWLSMSEESRTAAAEFLLNHSLMLEGEARIDGVGLARRRAAADPEPKYAEQSGRRRREGDA
jgi:hypothetical protein